MLKEQTIIVSYVELPGEGLELYKAEEKSSWRFFFLGLNHIVFCE